MNKWKFVICIPFTYVLVVVVTVGGLDTNCLETVCAYITYIRKLTDVTQTDMF